MWCLFSRKIALQVFFKKQKDMNEVITIFSDIGTSKSQEIQVMQEENFEYLS